MADQLPPKDKADLSTKVKGILKKAPAGPMRKDFKWDEKNLDRNEEEKVPRMKIDEPPTPYHNPEDDGASEEEESEGKEAETNIGPLLEHEPEQESNLNFKNARKRHYSMGHVMKKSTKKKNMAEYLAKLNKDWGVGGVGATKTGGKSEVR
ncbi:hypothetical protein AAMO2058_001545400 [Amorphochlora amoebiformis]